MRRGRGLSARIDCVRRHARSCDVPLTYEESREAALYFNDRYRACETDCIAAEPVDIPLDPESVSTPTPTENTIMTSKALDITTKTLANGVDIATMSDGDIYNLIASQEAEIETLSKIVNMPKRLIAEIEKRKAGIDALVKHLDSKP